MGSSHTICWKRRPRDPGQFLFPVLGRGHCQRDDREPARAPLFPLHPFSSYNTYYWCVFAPEEKVRLGEGWMCLIHVASLASSSAQAGLVPQACSCRGRSPHPCFLFISRQPHREDPNPPVPLFIEIFRGIRDV